MKKLLCIVAAAMFFLTAAAQEAVSVSGKVVDAQTSMPVAVASVNLYGTNISIVTNSDGEFTLKIPAGQAEGANIEITHLGYEIFRIPVSSFKDGDVLDISLAPMSLEIDAAVVKSLSASEIFKAAMMHIRDNYPNVHEGMTTFYREMIRKDNTKYLVLNEAVIDVAKAPYDAFAMDRAAVYKGRGSVDVNPSDTLFVKFKGGIMSALALDIAKDPFMDKNEFSAMEDFEFTLGEMSNIDDKPFYTIDFAPARGVKEPSLYKGRLFIDTESYAIARAEFEVVIGEKNKSDYANLFIVKMPSNTRFTVEQAKYEVNYKNAGDKWYFDYSKTNLIFTARKVRSFFRHTYSITSEMAVTDHKPELEAIAKKDRVSRADILTDDIKAFSDPDFWEDYNVILPEQSIQNAIQRIIRQLNRRNK